MKLHILALLSFILLIGSPIVQMPKMTTNAIIQPHIMETNSSSFSEHLNTNNETNTKFSEYDNNALAIKISYPADWKPTLKVSTNNFTFVEFRQNTTGSHQQHNPLSSFITLSVESISNLNQTLDSLTKQNLALANQTLPNFHLIDSNNTTFGNSPAYKIVYTFIDPSIRAPTTSQFQSMNIWTIKGDNIYTFSYSQPTSEYGRYFPTVERMIKSFQVTR